MRVYVCVCVFVCAQSSTDTCLAEFLCVWKPWSTITTLHSFLRVTIHTHTSYTFLSSFQSFFFTLTLSLVLFSSISLSLSLSLSLFLSLSLSLTLTLSLYLSLSLSPSLLLLCPSLHHMTGFACLNAATLRVSILAQEECATLQDIHKSDAVTDDFGTYSHLNFTHELSLK